MRARRVALWAAAVAALAALLLGGALWWVDTASGRAFVARQIAGYEFENGLSLRIGTIEGSIYGAAVLKNVRLVDMQGEFAVLPEAQLDWHPFALLRNRVAIDALIVPVARIARAPALRVVPDRGEPLLPDIDIQIGQVVFDRIVFAPALTGVQQVARLTGSASIADRRAIVSAAGRSDRGDAFTVKLDAVPDDNRFDIAAQLTVPQDGLVAGLTGRAVPVTASVAGKGSWQRWDGTATATVAGAKAANLMLTARDGRFAVRGTAAPEQIFGTMPLATALGPVADIAASAQFDRRVANVTARIGSEALMVAANGIADFAAGGFRDFTIDARQLRPSVLAANLSGDTLRARLVLNGDFAAPVANYAISANRLAFGDTVVEGLTVTGETRVAADRMIIPVTARARRISGVNAAAQGLLTNVRVSGELAYADRRILSDNLVIQSDRIDATAVIIADLRTGLYTGGLKGKVNGYQIDSVGIFNVEADVDLATQRSGYALTGTIRARSSRLFSAGVQDFLGGPMVVRAGVRCGTDGILRITSAAVAAPRFSLTQGSGSYRTDTGQIAFTGAGTSTSYGPVSILLSGTVARPVARVRATRPGLGVGLANVDALITRSRNGYLVRLSGGTDYGPVRGDLDIMSGTGPLTIDLMRADFAGIGLAGRVQQLRAGPFAGVLTGRGSGFDGTITLSGVGDVQRARVVARAANADLRGLRRLSIGRGQIDADIILYDTPQIAANVTLENVVAGNTTLAAARAKIAYRGGAGSAQVVAEGRSTVPFRIAANAALTPDLWRVAARGRANSIDFSTVAPLRIKPANAGYDLLPGSIRVGAGTVQLAGRYGSGLTLQSRLDGVELAIFEPLFPALGLGGRASGSVDWVQESPSAFPRADARLQIARFTRTSLGAVSQPVDIAMVGRLLPDGGNARVIIRRRGAVVGRLHVDLTPLPAGSGGWVTRLLAAPLAGGLRYNGPADTLFSLAALPDQSLTGTVGVAADFSGRVQDPRLTGVVRANDLVYENDIYGTRLTQLRVRGVFTNDQLEVSELSARAGAGTITGRGTVNLSSAKGFPVQLDLDLDRARIARSALLSSTATGQISVTSASGGDPVVRGTLRLPETRFRIVRQGAAKVTTLSGVRRKPAAGRARVMGNADPVSSLPSDWALDIKLVASDKLYVTGMGLESEWRANLQVTGTASAPRFGGQMDLVRGQLGFAGRAFTLDSGRLLFNGGPASNPTLRVSASSEIDGTTVLVNITGNGDNPQITFSSIPALPQDEIMARILFGNSIAELSALQAVQLAASLNALRGGSGGLDPLGVLQSATGIDRLRVLGADERTGRGTAVALGQYITNDVYIEIVTDARGFTASQIEISLTPALSLLSQISSFGTSNVNVRYRKDY